jgi:hypothetical protein
MRTEYMKAAFLGVWLIAVLIVAISIDPTATSHWIALACLAVAPPLMLRALWKVPEPTLAERIDEGRR